MTMTFKQFWTDEAGASAIGYALLAALIGVAIITATEMLGQEIKATFKAIDKKLGAQKPN